MDKLFIKAELYNELIEKGYGKRDLSKLTRKVITDKNGHKRTVFVRNDVQTIKRNPSINHKENSKTEKKVYWIQDWDGNRITSDDAKKRIKGIYDKLEYMESMKEGRTKDVVISIDAKKRQLENYQKDLISKLNPEDRKEIEKKQNEDKISSNGSAETEKILESLEGKRFSINDMGTRTYSISKYNNGYALTLNSDYVVQGKPIAGKITVNKDGSVTLHGYKTYGEMVADKDSDYARKNRVLREVSVKFSADELKNQNNNFKNKLRDYSQGYSSDKDFTIARV